MYIYIYIFTICPRSGGPSLRGSAEYPTGFAQWMRANHQQTLASCHDWSVGMGIYIYMVHIFIWGYRFIWGWGYIFIWGLIYLHVYIYIYQVFILFISFVYIIYIKWCKLLIYIYIWFFETCIYIYIYKIARWKQLRLQVCCQSWTCQAQTRSSAI